MVSNPTLPTENIDEVILRLLALEPNEVDELDYETYKSYLKELLVEVTSSRRKIAGGEVNLLKNEFKRVRGKKGRFRIRSKKVGVDKLGLGGIRKQIKGTQQRLMLAPSGGVPKQTSDAVIKKGGTETSSLVKINETLDSILSTLTNINSENRNKLEKERRDAESKKRSEKERQLELRPIEGIKKVISAVTKPFQSIWDKIVNFITNIVLGRIVLKLIDWIADPKNQGKIQTIIRFFKDNWPLLLTLYLRFGTSIGRFIGKLTGILVKGSLKLIQVTANLAARMGLKGAGRVGKFLGGRGGRLLGAGLTVGANVAGMMGASSAIEGFAGGETKVPGFSGGGWSGGIKNFFGNMFSGMVKGPKGRDKVPAMLTDGEFVMSTGAVRKYGVDTLESMNAAGGGTNVPQITDGVTYAAGGGYMGDYMKDQVKMRPATTDEMTGRSYRLQDLLGTKNQEEVARLVRLSGNKVPNIESLIGKDESLRFNQGHISKHAEGADEKTFKGLQRIYQQHFGVGPEFEKMMSNRVDAQMLDRSTTPKPTSTLKPKIPTLASELSPSYFLRGQSSLLPQRNPITSQSISSGYKYVAPDGGLPFRATGPGGDARIQRLAGQSGTMIPRNGSNKMSAMAKLLNNPALRFAGKAARVLDAPVIGDMILPEGSSEYDQRSNAYNDPRLSPVQRRIMMESVGLRGGAMKGGLGLKDQSFKDAPKTQIMTDDKGRPFVGYKALRGGKIVYVRGPQPGTGTTNPLEALGRMINPGAYKDIDATNERKKYEEASRNSVSSLKARGASQATIARRQAQLKTAVKPLPRATPKPIVAGGGMGGRRGGGANPSRQGTKPPSQSPTHRRGTMTSASAYGIMR